MTTRDHVGDDGKPLSQQAQDLEESIKGTVDNLLDTNGGSEAELSPEEKGALLGSAAVVLMEEDAHVAPEDRIFSIRSLWVWLILFVIIALGAGALAGAMVFLREDSGSASGTGAATPPPLAAPTAQALTPEDGEGGSEPNRAPSAACTLDPSAVEVESALTETISKEGSTQTGYRGIAAFTNASDVPIYLNLRRSQSVGDDPVEGWYDYQIPLAPGQVHTVTLTGQSWTNRDPTWTVYTAYAAYPATDECRLELGADTSLDELARPVASPLPVGPAS